MILDYTNNVSIPLCLALVMKIKHVIGKNICTHSFPNLKIKNNYIDKAYSFIFFNFFFDVDSVEVAPSFFYCGEFFPFCKKNIDPTTSKYIYFFK